MNTCGHPHYQQRECFISGDSQRTCSDCGHTWIVRDGELRFADGIFGAPALALLTPRVERTPAQRQILGLLTLLALFALGCSASAGFEPVPAQPPMDAPVAGAGGEPEAVVPVPDAPAPPVTDGGASSATGGMGGIAGSLADGGRAGTPSASGSAGAPPANPEPTPEPTPVYSPWVEQLYCFGQIKWRYANTYDGVAVTSRLEYAVTKCVPFYTPPAPTCSTQGQTTNCAEVDAELRVKCACPPALPRDCKVDP